MFFDIQLYLGVWFEIMKYPSDFDPSNSFNTTATYSMSDDGLVIHNSTIDLNGINLQANALGVVSDKIFDDGSIPLASLTVVFDQVPNIPGHYLIDNVFLGNEGEYAYAIVSNPSRDQLFVLSRRTDVPLDTILFLSEYLKSKYDITKVINVPHYMI